MFESVPGEMCCLFELLRESLFNSTHAWILLLRRDLLIISALLRCVDGSPPAGMCGFINLLKGDVLFDPVTESMYFDFSPWGDLLLDFSFCRGLFLNSALEEIQTQKQCVIWFSS